MHRSKLLLAIAAAAGLVLVSAQLVLAHSRPVRFDPAPGAVLDAAPEQVTGWFTSDLRRDSNWTHLRVTGPNGERVDEGEPELSADRREMSVALQSGLGPGRYVVQWSAWDDADGHILSDCVAFFVGQEAADAAVEARQRLDGGADCVRMDVAAHDATPVPGQVPGPGHGGENAEMNGDGDGNGGVPVWLFILGLGGALAVGLVTGRVVGSRS